MSRTQDFDESLQAALRAAYTDAVSYDEEDRSPAREEAQRYYNGEKFGQLAAEDGRSSIVLTEVRDTILSMMGPLMRPFVSSERVFEFVPRRADAVEQAALCTDYINEVVLAQDNQSHRLLHDAIKDALLFRTGIVKWFWDTSHEVVHSRHTGLSPEQAHLLREGHGMEGWDVEVVEESIEICGCDDLGDDAVEHLRGMAEQGEALPAPGVPVVLPGKPAPTPISGAPAAPAMPGAPMLPPGLEGPQAPSPAAIPGAMQAKPAKPATKTIEALPGLTFSVPGTAEVKFDLTIKRTRRAGVARVVNIPPEEFLITRDALNVESAPYVAHRSYKTVSELVSMGFDAEIIERHASGDEDMGIGVQTETLARNPSAYNHMNGDSPDPSLRRVLYVESYMLHDSDDDNIAERHRVCSVGGDCEIVHDEIVPEVPFAVFLMDPTPHTHTGQSIGDQCADLQVLKSFIMRNLLDSLAQSIHPRTIVLEGAANLDDVMNHETGAVIRVRQPGAVQELTTTFIGAQVAPILSFLDEIKAARTGISKATQGIDPDLLQSTTQSAVTAVTEAASQRLELIARNLAYTGMRPLARGLLRLIHRHQDRPRMARLREAWVEIDPRDWDAEMDCRISPTVGRDDSTKRIQTLVQILQYQQSLIEKLGPANPVVGLKEWRNTVSDIAEASGLIDSSRYFRAISPEIEAQMAQAMNGGQNKPDPNMLIAQAELQKAQAQVKRIEIEGQVELAKLAMAREEMKLTDDRERDRMWIELEVKKAEINARYGAQVDQASINAEVNRDRAVVGEIGNYVRHVTPQPTPADMQMAAQPPLDPSMQQPGSGFPPGAPGLPPQGGGY
jgi:hypothetical protein